MLRRFVVLTVLFTFGFLLCLALLPPPSFGSSLFLDGTGSALLGSGDVLDQVIASDASTVTMQGGSVIEDFTLLDSAQADIFGGTIGGPFEAYDASQAVIHTDGVAPIELDGAAIPHGTILDSVLCPECQVGGVLADGSNFLLTLKIAQDGKVSLVPEPATAALLGLGLVGLVVAGRRVAC